MNTPPTAGRLPWLAVVLSLFCTGLGHVYCGRLVTGLVLFLAVLLFAPAVVLAALLPPSTPLLVGLILATLAVLAVIVFAAADAYRVARRLRDHYEPREYNRGILYALFILVGVSYPALAVGFLRANVFEAFLIPTASEVPNLLPGDHILVNKLAPGRRFPRRGDVVVFHHPRDRRLTFVKRVIGLPGDRVAVRQGRVRLNGKELEHDPVPRASLEGVPESAGGEVFTEANAGRRYRVLLGPASPGVPDFAEHRVPEGSLFVLGDNRNDSTDSRQFGFVPLGDLVGLVEYVYHPAGSWARFGAYTD